MQLAVHRMKIHTGTVTQCLFFAKELSLIDHVGTIEVNIRDVDLSTCDSGFMKGERVIWIKFTAIVTLGSDEGTMQVAVLWNGRKGGSGGFKFVHE